MRADFVALVALVAAVGLADAAAAAAAVAGLDHQSHAVTGGPYNTFADDGAAAVVALDGRRSHSHYFTANDTGRIVRYAWSVGGRQVCGKAACKVEFGHGISGLRLEVEDQVGSVAVAETTVSVGRWEVAGLRAWFFTSEGKPVSSADVAGLNGVKVFEGATGKGGQAVFRGRVRGEKGRVQYRIACVNEGGGWCYLGVGASVAHGADGGIGDWMDVDEPVVGLFVSVMAYAVTGTETVRVERRFERGGVVGKWSVVPESALVYEPRVFAPVINTAPEAVVPGGVVKLTGTGFSVGGLKVSIGGELCGGVQVVGDDVLTCVVGGDVVPDSAHKFLVETEAGQSNVQNVSVGKSTSVGLFQEVGFDERFLADGKGKASAVNQPTSVAIGPDGRYYVGSLDGYVHALTVDENYRVTKHCVSERVGGKAGLSGVLGVAFNPADYGGPLKLYASVNLLYYTARHKLPTASHWDNGKIVTFGVDVGGHCLGISNGALVTGLPVSNHDHGINGIQFDDSGVLYVTSGSSTNGGKSDINDNLGGVPDSPLSGAMLRIPVLSPGFDGKVVYSNPTRPDLAAVISGNVSTFSVGLRNVFNHVYHSNGKHYALDNGANEGFGDFSTGCAANQTRPSKHDGDSLRLVLEDSYHGYANINRGRSDARQCVKYDLDSKAGAGYTQQIASFESATVGLTEFTKNSFGGSMRGNLLATKFAIESSGKTFRIVLAPDGNGVESQYELAAYSGLSVAETPYGGLVMPRVWQGKVAVLSAREKNPGVVAVTGVTPHRGPRGGGNSVLITGWNLKAPISVTFGGEVCTDPSGFAASGRSFRCVVPAGKGKVPVVVTRGGQASKSWGWEYAYMNV